MIGSSCLISLLHLEPFMVQTSWSEIDFFRLRHVCGAALEMLIFYCSARTESAVVNVRFPFEIFLSWRERKEEECFFFRWRRFPSLAHLTTLPDWSHNFFRERNFRKHVAQNFSFSSFFSSRALASSCLRRCAPCRSEFNFCSTVSVNKFDAVIELKLRFVLLLLCLRSL